MQKKNRRRDIEQNEDDLHGNEFDTIPFEDWIPDPDATQTDSQKERGEVPKKPPSKKKMDVFAPSNNSLIQEILQETQPTEKIEKNLFGQYMRSLEPAAPGLVRKPLPPFLSKLLAKEEQDRIDQNRIASFDFLPLFEMLHKEYKIEFDLDLAKYYKCLILIKGCEIYDQDCFDANLPPIDTIRYSDISAMET